MAEEVRHEVVIDITATPHGNGRYDHSDLFHEMHEYLDGALGAKGHGTVEEAELEEDRMRFVATSLPVDENLLTGYIEYWLENFDLRDRAVIRKVK